MQSCIARDRGSLLHDLWRLRFEPLLHLASGLSGVGSFVLIASEVSARMAHKGSFREEESAAPETPAYSLQHAIPLQILGAIVTTAVVRYLWTLANLNPTRPCSNRIHTTRQSQPSVP